MEKYHSHTDASVSWDVGLYILEFLWKSKNNPQLQTEKEKLTEA